MNSASKFVLSTGFTLCFLGLFLLVLIFYPIIFDEVYYFFSSKTALVSEVKKENVIVPLDTNFGIVIPKIHANAKIIPNIDPFNSLEYQIALTKGVAQAKGSVLPGEAGNLFLFSHSSVNFYDAVRYNSIFYLLYKLNKNDSVDIFYKGKEFTYKITDKKTVSPSDMQYFNANYPDPTLTLMTCWPPGTTFQRLILIAKLKQG